MTNKLPTKSELRAQLEKRAEMYREDGFDVGIVKPSSKCLCLVLYRGGHKAMSSLFRYRPAPQPPGDLEAVFVFNDDKVHIKMSTGRLVNGMLVCYISVNGIVSSHNFAPYSDYISCVHWYNPKTGEHSDGFPVDQLPERFRK